MKKKLGLVLSLGICLGLLGGCGNKLDVEESTVYVDKDGSVISVDMEDFEADYYDEDELKDYVNETIDAYTSENGKKSVSLSDFSVEDSMATLTLKYKTADDYTSFSGIELYTGTVVKAMAAGYDFGVDFVSVEDGTVTGTATKDEILENDDYKVAIIKANTDLKVDGKIVYVSSENVNVTSKNTVSIREGYSAAPAEDVANETATESILSDGTETASTETASTETASTESTESTEATVSNTGDVNLVDDEFAYESDVYTYVIFK